MYSVMVTAELAESLCSVIFVCTRTVAALHMDSVAAENDRISKRSNSVRLLNIALTFCMTDLCSGLELK